MPVKFGGRENGQGSEYDVARDGRFLNNVTSEETTTSPITLIQSWKPPAK